MQTRSSVSKTPQPTPLRRSQRLLNQAKPVKSQDLSAQKSESKKTPSRSTAKIPKKLIESCNGSRNSVNSASGLRRSPRLNSGSFSKKPEETKFVETNKAESRKNAGKDKGELLNGERKVVERKERVICVGLKAVTPAGREVCERNEEVGIKRGIKRKRKEGGDGKVKIHGWTREQELALQRAYFSAKPTPNFWKKVSKLVTLLLPDI